ncbi:odorant receptor Or2-like [Nylanderia fulva]|uniref:odorant receptor Or2-like n=1 Tax=Nylanderia fulva TaxID=613905 RepID=UPI0010FB3D7B|nr:odorant receptor Or2-like [Nylanderia fulva]
MNVSLEIAFNMKTSIYSTYQVLKLLRQTDFQWAVKLHRYSLEFIGLWPKSKQTSWEKRMCNLRILFILSIIIFLILPCVHSLIRIHSDIILLMDNLQYTLGMIISVLKIIIFWWKKTVVSPIIDMIANDWTKTNTFNERIIMIERARTARIIVTIAYVVMGVGTLSTNGLPIFGYSTRYITNITDPGRLLPFQTYYIYDVTKSPQYEITFSYQVIAMILCIIPYTGIDNFFSLLIFHISGQLDILNNRLKHLSDIANYNDILRSVVKDHMRLLRAIAIIEDTYNILFLALFMLFGVLFICYGFLLTNMFEDGFHLSLSQLAYLITVVVNIFGHMCMYCALGEFLTAQCDQIHFAVYSNKWYNMDPKNARSLILLLIRTNKPLHLSAGKVFPLTMATFCDLLKTLAGYISVLLTIKN